MKKHIITIAGKVGSGKSSTAKAVAKKLDYDHYSSGDFFRSIAVERGINVTELNHLAETTKEIDHEVDERNKQMADKSDVVIDSRMAWYFIPNSFKVFLDIDEDIAAQRIYDSISDDPARATELKALNVTEMANDMRQRLVSEKKRYRDLYNVDHHASENFDVVINTGKSENDLETVVDMVVAQYQEWLANK